MYTLRPYQSKIVDSLLKNNHSKMRLAVSPQGSGKSIIITELSKILSNNSVLITTSRLVLLDQLKVHLSGNSNATIVSRGSLHKVQELSFDYVIIDEAHEVNIIGQFQDFLNKRDCIVMGLTATPYRMDIDIKEIWGEPVIEIERNELISHGYLADREIIPIPLEMMINVTPADWYLSKSHVNNLSWNNTPEILEFILRHPPKFKGIIFCCSINQGKYISEHIGAKLVGSHLSIGENRQLIKEFKEGDQKLIISVDKLTVGFDEKQVKSIYNLRPTTSYTLYEQMIGRGDRKLGLEKNKIYDFTFATVDFAKSKSQFFKPCHNCGVNIDKRWNSCPHCGEKVYRTHKQNSNNEKECPTCTTLNLAKSRFCINCGFYLVRIDNLWTKCTTFSMRKIAGYFEVSFSNKFEICKMNTQEYEEFLSFLGGNTISNINPYTVIHDNQFKIKAIINNNGSTMLTEKLIFLPKLKDRHNGLGATLWPTTESLMGM